jgi:hypothetical protein
MACTNPWTYRDGMDFGAIARLVRCGDLAALAGLADSGWDVNQDDGHTGTTALLVACESGRADVARLLLARGTDLNRVHRDGWNCYDSGSLAEIRELVVAHGFDLHIRQAAQARGLESLRVLSPARPGSETWQATVLGTEPTVEYRTAPFPSMYGRVLVETMTASFTVDAPGHRSHRLPTTPEPERSTITVTLERFRGELQVRLFCEDLIRGSEGPREFWLPTGQSLT